MYANHCVGLACNGIDNTADKVSSNRVIINRCVLNDKYFYLCEGPIAQMEPQWETAWILPS